MNVEFCAPDFSLLPAHIITQILWYLDIDDFRNASSICKSWHYASTDPKIIRTLSLQPIEENFPEICKLYRRYGVLKLEYLKFDKVDSYYFELFEKVCPYIHELYITDSDLKLHHLLKLLELTTCLRVFSLNDCSQLEKLPGLFPRDYDYKAKKQIVKKLSAIKNIAIKNCINVSLIADFLRFATNLDTFEFSNEFGDFDMPENKPYQKFFTIFDNCDAENLTRLNLDLYFNGYADDFITSFLKLKILNLKSFKMSIWSNWESGAYKSLLFRHLMLKIQNLVELNIDGLIQDQLSLICQHLVNLKSFKFRLLDNDQPISELANLTKLEKLRCLCYDDTHISFCEIDKFFKCKFKYLRIFHFDRFVTESNLMQLCVNHPNLIDLRLTCLLTRNLEIIFKHSTKLRILMVHLGLTILRPELREIIRPVILFDSDRQFEYKISRLQDLEKFYLDEFVNGIDKDDVRNLKKLRATNYLVNGGFNNNALL